MVNPRLIRSAALPSTPAPPLNAAAAAATAAGTGMSAPFVQRGKFGSGSGPSLPADLAGAGRVASLLFLGRVGSRSKHTRVVGSRTSQEGPAAVPSVGAAVCAWISSATEM